mmetsp:Transcript_138092/g.195461  ORF Transcript_138092/g.195461 Transcript_138092/m.195461 type:complete len:85 (-) Transcript_138092:70-324(-)
MKKKRKSLKMNVHTLNNWKKSTANYMMKWRKKMMMVKKKNHLVVLMMMTTTIHQPKPNWSRVVALLVVVERQQPRNMPKGPKQP